jgi:hypothetical protein
MTNEEWQSIKGGRVVRIEKEKAIIRIHFENGQVLWVQAAYNFDDKFEYLFLEVGDQQESVEVYN